MAEPDLADVLDRYNANTIQQFGQQHGFTQHGGLAKLDLLPLLVARLRDPQYIQRAYADLSKPERALLEALIRRGGMAPTRSLRELLRSQKLVNPDKPRTVNPRQVGSRYFEDVLARLTLRGLVFAVEDRPQGMPAFGTPPKLNFDYLPLRVFIPAATLRALPALAPEPARAAPPAAVGATQAGSARTFQRDLYLYWSYVQRAPLTLTAKDEPHKTALREVNASLLVKEELGKGEGELEHPRLRFVRLVLADLDLLRPQAGNQWRAHEPAEFFALPAAERVRLSCDAWLHSTSFSEIVLLPAGVRPNKLNPNNLTASPGLQQGRQAALDTLGQLAGGGEWLALDHFIGVVRAHDYEFLIPRPPPNRYNYYYDGGPYSYNRNPFGVNFEGFANEAEGWERVEANLLRGLVSGPLHWLGLVDLGWAGATATGSATAFRLTPLGRWVLGQGPQPEIPAEGGRVIVLPNLHVVALDPVNDATLLTLDRFAQRLSAERAVEYVLTRESVYAGQQAGWEVERIMAFLRAQPGVEMPANVARTLDEWQAQHNRIVLRPAVALAHGPAELLSALADAPVLSGQIAGRPAPEVLRLSGPAAIPALVEAVGAQGSLPVVSAQPTVPANSVVADENGLVRLLARRPNLYLHGSLAAYADPAGERAYQLSPASLSRALRAGLDAAAVLKQLAAIHRGPVPEALARRIRAWAKHYGDAALEAVVLLQVRDAATLAELAKDPELAPLLKPFKPKAAQALARVRPEDVEMLRAKLAERGIALGEELD